MTGEQLELVFIDQPPPPSLPPLISIQPSAIIASLRSELQCHHNIVPCELIVEVLKKAPLGGLATVN